MIRETCEDKLCAVICPSYVGNFLIMRVRCVYLYYITTLEKEVMFLVALVYSVCLFFC